MIQSAIRVFSQKLHASSNLLVSDDRGQDLIEYALLAGLIAVVCVASMQGVATAITTIFGTISTDLNAA